MPSNPVQEKAVEAWAAKRVSQLQWQYLKLGLLIGIPDRLILAKQARVAFIEFKSRTGTRGTLQKRWFRTLSNLGFIVRLCRSKHEVDAVLEILGDEHLYRRELHEIQKRR